MLSANGCLMYKFVFLFSEKIVSLLTIGIILVTMSGMVQAVLNSTVSAWLGCSVITGLVEGDLSPSDS